MSYKHVEASREVRLWITQVIIPAVTVIMLTVPEARNAVVQIGRDMSQSIKRKFDKGKVY